MWALRQASLLLRNRGFNVRASCIKSVSATWVEDDSGILESSRRAYDRLLLPDTFYHSVIRRELSSQADDSSTKDQDDLEDGKDKSNDIKDGEKSHDKFDFSKMVRNHTDKGRLPAQSEVFKLIVSSPSISVHEHLDNWVDEGKRLSREELSLAMVNLRMHKLYFQALELSQWVASNRDHATHVDLIAQMPQLNEIEMYVKSIPKSSPRRKLLSEALDAATTAHIKTNEITVRKHIANGHKKEAEDLLKRMEGENLRENSWLGQYLLPLYANLGKADEVRRIWEVCKTSSKLAVYLAAIKAFGLLKRIDDAEAIFEMVLNRWKLSNKDYVVMFKVYLYNNMLAKGKDLFMRMEDSGCQIDPSVWDALVKLHIQAGEVEKAKTYLQKAEAYLQKAVMLSPLYPLRISYDAVMKHYAKRGDDRNSDRILEEMKQAGYKIGTRQYKILLEAYANAKLTPDEIMERMKGHGIFPDDLFWRRLDLNLSEFVHPLLRNVALELLKMVNLGKPTPAGKDVITWEPRKKVGRN